MLNKISANNIKEYIITKLNIQNNGRICKNNTHKLNIKTNPMKLSTQYKHTHIKLQSPQKHTSVCVCVCVYIYIYIYIYIFYSYHYHINIKKWKLRVFTVSASMWDTARVLEGTHKIMVGLVPVDTFPTMLGD